MDGSVSIGISGIVLCLGPLVLVALIAGVAIAVSFARGGDRKPPDGGE